MPASLGDFLFGQGLGNVVGVYQGRFVQLVNNVTGKTIVSASPSNAQGLFSIANVPAGNYTLSISSNAGGPWTQLDPNYQVGDESLIFNARDYGAKGDGVTDDTTAIQGAISDCQTAGGGIVLIPFGTYKTTAALQVTSNVRVLVIGWGATLQPAASTDCLFVRQANGATALGCEIDGLTIDGQSRATTVGIRIRDTDRCTVRNCRIVNCTTGVQIESFTSTRWAEENAIKDSFIFNCTTGVNVAAPGGTFSLGETHMWNVGISSCATGLALNSPSTFYRCRLLGLTIWLPTNGTGILMDCNMQDSVIIADLENLNGTQTGLTGVNVTTNALNIPSLDMHLGFTGTFATTVSDSTGKGFTWSDGTRRFTTAAGNGFWGAMALSGDTVDRVRFAGQFAGGGGVQFGIGSGNPDVNLYRLAAGVLKTDGAFARSRQTPTEAVLVSGVDATAGELVGVTLTAARLVGAPLNPQIGQRLTFTLIQGGAGAFAVTWNAVFKKTWSDVGNATGARSSISYQYDGSNWNQDGAQAPYV